MARLLGVVLFLLVTAAHGAVIRVGTGSGCDFTTIGDALDSLADGDHNYQILVTGQTFAENLVVDGKFFTLDGAYANCTDTTRGGTTTITRDHTGDSILEVRGNSQVVLANLTITNGSITSLNGAGGGINFDGHGTLTLANVAVVNNYAGYGGGINVDPSGGDASLYLKAGTVILNNTAQYSGGGIRMHDSSTLYALEDHTLIFGNQAIGFNGTTPRDGYGGGIEFVAPSRGYIGSPGYNGEGVVTGNTARYGGGISLTGAGGNSDYPRLELFTTSASAPVRISANRATVSGGAIQLEPNYGISTNSIPYLCAYEFRIDGNYAPNGSAIYAADGTASYTHFNLTPNGLDCGPDPFTTFAAVRCQAGIACNQIDGNISKDANDQPTNGATLFFNDLAQLDAYAVSIIDNQGGRALDLRTDYGAGSIPETLSVCLIANNVLTGEVISTSNNTPLSLKKCTIAGNTIGGGNVLSMSDDFDVLSSIVWQPGKTAFAHVGGTGSLTANDLLTSDTGSFAGASGFNVFNADPRFIDPAHDDFHLQPASGAVDAGKTGVVGSTDRDGKAYCRDMSLVANLYPAAGTAGACDLGAYELQSIGNLVLNPGFDTDLRLWSEVVPGTNQWQDASIAYASPSTRIFIQPSANGTHAGLTQCVRLPGPGVYELTGKGSGFNFGITNATRIHWRYLAGTDDDCAAASDVEGDLYFPLAADGLPRPSLSPAFINVAPARWGFYSAIQLTTFVDTTNAGPSFNTVGAFDDISIIAASDEIFRNGFD